MTASQRDPTCPRCRYNLRGLPTPRCPECGLTFALDEWQRGELRENVPARLDRCDPWQPHAVLWAALRDLLQTMARPRWVFTQLTPRGPRWVPAAMLGLGLMWVYLATALGGAVALALHAGVSPYAAGKAGLLWWAPRIVLFAAALACTAPVCVVAACRPGRPGAQPGVIRRTLAFWVPGVTACLALPGSWAYVVVPTTGAFAAELAFVVALMAVAYAVVMLRGWPLARRPKLVLALLPATFLVAVALHSCWPSTLEPPVWVYL